MRQSPVDAYWRASLALAAGLIWSSRERKSWLAATTVVLAALVLTGFDARGCSTGSKVRLAYEKLAGHLPYLTWSQIGRDAFSRACFATPDSPETERGIQQIGEKVVDGRQLALFRTSMGDFWIAAASDGRQTLAWLQWEIDIRRDYESGGVVLRAGDTVIDCGAHVGVFTRHALRRGAARVVAVEPAAENIAALEASFAPEIADGRVLLVKGGVWDQRATLLLSDDSTARHSFLSPEAHGGAPTGAPVFPLDDIVREHQLDRVDFIKMDIEGAERRALAGARETLARFKPRMAICTYHLRDDMSAVPAVVLGAVPGYSIHAKNVEARALQFQPKVLFFHQAL